MSASTTASIKAQRLVLADPVAVRYLQEDADIKTIETEAKLIGYEMHLVEQWACSRTHPTFLIATFTGIPKHKVSVSVLGVPKDEDRWPSRLKTYLKALSDNYARRKETNLGTFMVTNLNSFPSALTVIPISEINVSDSRENFTVNENLKRLGCSGRSGLNLEPPSTATAAKFTQLYGTHDRIPIGDAVIEMVKLCQNALIIFNKLDAAYDDGLLCDLTEKAINDWWTEVGMDYFTAEPSDGVLGPSGVASILGLFLGARNRLHAFGAPVAKDAFDLKAMKRGIAYFQKSQKLARSRRLDHKTLDRLHRVTSKAANSEGWGVPKAVKSTVAELSGKGGEMVMGMVGGKDRAGIAEVETPDLQKFVRALSGERCKWLWYGRSKKLHANEGFGVLVGDDELAVPGEHSARHSLVGKRNDGTTESGIAEGFTLTPSPYFNAYTGRGSQSSLDTLDKEPTLHKAVLKSVTAHVGDAKSGLDRFKDVVGITNRKGRPSKELQEGCSKAHSGMEVRDTPVHDSLVGAQKQWIESACESVDMQPVLRDGALSDIAHHRSHVQIKDRDTEERVKQASEPLQLEEKSRAGSDRQSSKERTSRPESGSLLVSGKDHSLNLTALTNRRAANALSEWTVSRPGFVRSAQSLNRLKTAGSSKAALVPRHVSFTAVEPIIRKRSLENSLEHTETDPSILHLQQQIRYTIQNKQSIHLHDLMQTWANDSVNELDYVDELRNRAARDCVELQSIHIEKADEWTGLRDSTTDLLREEGSSVTDALKDAEILGAKLDYELAALASKIEDVEDGVVDFERQVLELEGRARELKRNNGRRISWLPRAIGFAVK